MTKIQFYPEEYSTKDEDLKELEALLGAALPIAYANYLKEYNGGQVHPSVPTIKSPDNVELWAIERFLSVKDLILQRQCKMEYDLKMEFEEEFEEKYSLDLNLLICIAIHERGNYFMYLGKEDFGRLYMDYFQLNTVPFDEFIQSLDFWEWDEEKLLPNFEDQSKLKETRLFSTPQNPLLGLRRFKEVHAFKPNYELRKVCHLYKDNRPFLDYMLEAGLPVEGIIELTLDFNTIHYLVTEHGANINERHGKFNYPLQSYTHSSSYVVIRYKLMHQLLSSDIAPLIDFSILDENGKNIKARLRDLATAYANYCEKEKQLYPTMQRDFLVSDVINQIIK